jgi:hypothetical protein
MNHHGSLKLEIGLDYRINLRFQLEIQVYVYPDTDRLITFKVLCDAVNMPNADWTPLNSDH